MNIVRTKRIGNWATALLVTMTLFGCATISEHTNVYLGSSKLAPTNPANIKILTSEPKEPKERLGEILLSIDGKPSRDKIEEKVRTAAAQLGADAVFIVSDRTRITPLIYWNYWGPGTVDEDVRRHIVAVAFKYK